MPLLQKTPRGPDRRAASSREFPLRNPSRQDAAPTKSPPADPSGRSGFQPRIPLTEPFAAGCRSYKITPRGPDRWAASSRESPSRNPSRQDAAPTKSRPADPTGGRLPAANTLGTHRGRMPLLQNHAPRTRPVGGFQPRVPLTEPFAAGCRSYKITPCGPDRWAASSREYPRNPSRQDAAPTKSRPADPTGRSGFQPRIPLNADRGRMPLLQNHALRTRPVGGFQPRIPLTEPFAAGCRSYKITPCGPDRWAASSREFPLTEPIAAGCRSYKITPCGPYR